MLQNRLRVCSNVYDQLWNVAIPITSPGLKHVILMYFKKCFFLFFCDTPSVVESFYVSFMSLWLFWLWLEPRRRYPERISPCLTWALRHLPSPRNTTHCLLLLSVVCRCRLNVLPLFPVTWCLETGSLPSTICLRLCGVSAVAAVGAALKFGGLLTADGQTGGRTEGRREPSALQPASLRIYSLRLDALHLRAL